jgi:hypothetical protein
MIKRKDNLTDLAEELPKVEVVENPNPPKNQQVVDSEGELITLGNKNKKKKNLSTYGKSFELIERIIKETIEKETDKISNKIKEKIEKAIVEKELDKMAETIIEKVEKKLKEEGLI